MKSLSVYWVLFSAAWYFLNGVLHDIFVIIQHKGKYDRELLRLLMDGHVLILSGIVVFICYFMIQSGIRYGAIISLVIAAGMLVYCMMIFPFLKSFGTILVSLLLLIVSLSKL